MRAIKNSVQWPAALLIAILAGVIGYQSNAQRGMQQAQPSAIAIVNLEKVFNGLTQRGDADANLRKLAEKLDADGQAKRDSIERLREELELFMPGTPQFDETSQNLARQGYQLQAYLDFASRKLDVEKARALRALYASIKETAAKFALDFGYDVVFVDDSVVPLPEDGTEAETMRQISARRTLYANPQVDITQDVIDRMNENHVAQGG